MRRCRLVDAGSLHRALERALEGLIVGAGTSATSSNQRARAAANCSRSGAIRLSGSITTRSFPPLSSKAVSECAEALASGLHS